MHPQQEQKKDGGRRRRSLLAAAFALAVALFTASAVYAGLTADATGTEQIQSGVLSLVVAPDAPSAGFSNFVAPMAPGDEDNVFVNVVNNGTLANAGPITLTVTGTSDANSALLNSATEGLAVEVIECTVAWTYTASTAPTCSGSTSTVLADQLVSALSGGVNLNGAALAPGGAVNHLLVSVGLSGTENTHNGVVPAPGIQGHSAQLNFSFSESQRAGVVTNQ